MRKDVLRQWINVLAVIGTIVVNGLANALPLNGQTTGSISDRFRVYFVPAGYVFAIWGVIYLGLIAFAVYQALPSQRGNPRLHRIGYLLALSCVANSVWLFLWHYNVFTWTLVAMFSLLALLIVIYLSLGIGRARYHGTERWCLALPFSIYLGWITVATIANVTSVLDFVRWTGWGISPVTWTVIMLAGGVLIAALMSLTRGDIAYSFVIIWGFIGIAIKHAGTPTVATSAWIATVLVAVMLAVGLLARGRAPRSRGTAA